MDRRDFIARGGALVRHVGGRNCICAGFRGATARGHRGAGAAGLALAARLRRQMENATIILIDAKKARASLNAAE